MDPELGTTNMAQAMAQATPEKAKPERKALTQDEKATRAAKAAATKAAAVEKERVLKAQTPLKSEKCRLCGKSMEADVNIQRGIGPICLPRIAINLKDGEALVGKGAIDEARLLVLIAKARGSFTPHFVSSAIIPQTSEAKPRPYVKVAAMHLYCEANKVSVSLMVRAFGGDRAVNPPLNPNWKPIYVGRTRYLHPDCMTAKGMAELRKQGTIRG